MTCVRDSEFNWPKRVHSSTVILHVHSLKVYWIIFIFLAWSSEAALVLPRGLLFLPVVKSCLFQSTQQLRCTWKIKGSTWVPSLSVELNNKAQACLPLLPDHFPGIIDGLLLTIFFFLLFVPHKTTLSNTEGLTEVDTLCSLLLLT